jgi:hypothetical protein
VFTSFISETVFHGIRPRGNIANTNGNKLRPKLNTSVDQTVKMTTGEKKIKKTVSVVVNCSVERVAHT